MDFRLVRATENDLPFIMATERRAGYDAFVGRWDEPCHRQAFADGTHAYFVGIEGSAPIGFVILRGWASAERVTLVKRIAVVAPGQGQGRMLLAAAIDRAFVETDAYRLCISLFPDNHRARRAYEAVGFTAEGIARGSAFFNGVHRDELVMAQLRPEWERRAGTPA
ncbi:GNAT family N-acetyltransferase [Mesorhizobium sp. SEMIA 3007]|uniref:GNAT family N-acetyltransferase n=1 Tax=Mesorhizobium sp. SEMIA 3007 TaxID=1862350 RepID=UPI00083DB839|nr:GNAT family N-acetyltransferase [Mesorhizobium sp. SEMIA 3007]ODA92028.1 GNAT family N-acetyltransferase [Mesorhizobium sp. SEMIA 3007]